MNDTSLFAFENDFVATLRCIPMAVRFKLDLAGVKISLRQWSRFTVDDRQALLLARCAGEAEIDAYRARLIKLLAERLQQAPSPLPLGSTVPWNEAEHTPEQVRGFAQFLDVDSPSDNAWRRLTSLQRFVLLKLSRDSHDNVNFVPALREFELLQPDESDAAARSYATSS